MLLARIVVIDFGSILLGPVEHRNLRISSVLMSPDHWPRQCFRHTHTAVPNYTDICGVPMLVSFLLSELIALIRIDLC